jgi:cytochrome c peroxidase
MPRHPFVQYQLGDIQMRKTGIALLVAGAALLGACGTKPAAVDDAKLKMFAPLPEQVPAKTAGPLEAQVALGRMLYYDARLSKSQTVACNSCHALEKYGVDGAPTSVGFKGQHGDRNSPTVYNAAIHFVQFWDGRAPDVEAQAKGPVLNPVEMAMDSDAAVVGVLESIPEYVSAFQKAFPNDKKPVTYDNMAAAIGAFERGLLTPSRWDKFLKGDKTALTEQEQAGFHAFVSAGCDTCHAGALLGGNLYQKIGVMKPYPDTSDPGRYKVTKIDSDRMMFKVPSLRNVAKTAPYFHDGKVGTLDKAVVEMADYQLDKQLSQPDTAAIVAFLNALTGEIPASYIQKPELPKSTAKTPKPVAGD